MVRSGAILWQVNISTCSDGLPPTVSKALFGGLFFCVGVRYISIMCSILWDIGMNGFIEKAVRKHGDVYDYSKVIYVRSTEKVTIICRKHGEFLQTPAHHVSGKGCPICKSGGRLTTSEFVERARALHGDKYDYSKCEYIDSKTAIVIICREHGEFSQTPHSHLNTVKRCGCQECGKRRSNAKRSMTTDEFIVESRKVHGDKYDYTDTTLTNNKTPVTITCPTHGVFTQTPWHHIHQSSGCPKCSNCGPSRAESDLFDFVRSLCPDAVQSDRSVIGPQELDIIVPSRHVAFEFNGLYWHNERTKGKMYHISKRERAEAAGYRLVSIREDLWCERRDQVVKIIRTALGVSSGSVFARKCVIVNVSALEAKVFMNQHHVQGYRGATVHYGLMYRGGLVAVISLTNWKVRGEWELVRYATSCNVPGGLSRLWKHAVTTKNIHKAYSYVDRDLFTGSSYSHAGFKYSSTTVGFRIVKGGKTESRQKWNKAPDGMTQSQWYDRENVSRIYDSGQDRLSWYTDDKYN